MSKTSPKPTNGLKKEERLGSTAGEKSFGPPVSSGRKFCFVSLLLFVFAAGWLWWLCERSDNIPFLPAWKGAEWIVYPSSAEALSHDATQVTAKFKHRFTLSAAPGSATLEVRAFRSCAVHINGRDVGDIRCEGSKWKSSSVADVAGLLQAGTNEITVWVTNAVSPPALWLKLDTGQLSLGSGEKWLASRTGMMWQQARLAKAPPPIRPGSLLDGGERTMDSLKRAWPVEMRICAISLVLVLIVGRFSRERISRRAMPPFFDSGNVLYGFLAFVVIARAALSINNLPQLPPTAGFDAQDHEQYVRFIQEHHALPFANDGWEMYQPPLFYAAASALPGTSESAWVNCRATLMVRAMNGMVGLVHCWLILLCLRLLFPESLPAQIAGLLVAAFLPPHIYLSQFVTNETLAGLFVTVGIYFYLRALRAETSRWWLPIGMGVALGAAMLTKSSSLLAVPVFLAALGLRLQSQNGYTVRLWFRDAVMIVASCLVICGWYYGLVWSRFGRPLVGNWDANIGSSWWQDPGFRTGAFYTGFGHVFMSPLFSGLHSFSDGIYSTLWGDGLTSGMGNMVYRPPWNYDLMCIGYLLAAGMSILFVAGFALALTRFFRHGGPEWFLMAAMLLIFGLGIFYMSLRVPSYAQVKAFYAFPTLLPFSVLVATGWDWLRQKHRALNAALCVLLCAWAMTAYETFWVRSGNPAKSLSWAFYFSDNQRYAEAAANLSDALQLMPHSAATHRELGTDLLLQGKLNQAAVQFNMTIELQPANSEAHRGLGVILASKGALDGAVSQLATAVQLNPDDAISQEDLGAILANEKRFDEAIPHYREAIGLNPGDAEAHENLGVALVPTGRLDEAIEELQAALKLRPDLTGVRERLRAALELKANARAGVNSVPKP